MTNKERAEKILDFIDETEPRRSLHFIRSQLDEAVIEAMKDREVAYEKDLQMRIDKAVREEYWRCQKAFNEEMIKVRASDLDASMKIDLKTSEDSYSEGFAAAQGKAARIVAETPGNTYTSDCDHNEIAERIRSMK